MTFNRWFALCLTAQQECLHAYVIAHHECVELCQWPEER